MTLSADLVCALLFFITLARPAFGVGIWVALIPLLEYVFNVPQYPYHTLTVFAAVVAGAVLLRRFKSGRTFWRPLLIFSGILGLLLTVSIAHFGSILFAYPRIAFDNLFASNQLNPFVFFGTTTLWGIAAVLFLGLVGICRESEADRRALLILLWCQAPVYLIVLAVDFILYSKPFPGILLTSQQSSSPGLFAIFSEHNTFAAFFLLHAFLLIGAVIAASSRRTRLLSLVLLGTYTVLIVFSLSLTTFVALGLSFLVVLAIVLRRSHVRRRSNEAKPSNRKFVLIALVLVAAVGLAGLSVGNRRIGDAVSRRVSSVTWRGVESGFYERRGYAWQIATDMIRDYPFLGVGLGRFYLEFHEYRQRRGTEGAGWFWEHALYENAHNYFLQVAAEAGLLGLVLLIWLLVRIFSGAFRGPPESATAAYGLIAILAVSLLQHPLLVDSLFFTVIPIAALAMVPESRLPSLPRWSVGVLLGLLLVGALVDVYHAADRMPKEFEYGLFGIERGPVGSYRWTGRIALKRGPWKEGGEHFQIRPAVAGLEAHPLIVRFRRMDDGRQLADWAPVDPGWVPFQLPLNPGDLLAIDCSRVIRPPGEYRTLGIAITVSPGSGFRPLRTQPDSRQAGK
jgi:O-antigen ligase